MVNRDKLKQKRILQFNFYSFISQVPVKTPNYHFTSWHSVFWEISIIVAPKMNVSLELSYSSISIKYIQFFFFYLILKETWSVSSTLISPPAPNSWTWNSCFADTYKSKKGKTLLTCLNLFPNWCMVGYSKRRENGYKWPRKAQD